ncbi:transcription termination/antitermination protein NusG [Treponema sp.]|uniref:transcription termination/antitermination protein NusG n=1 Tax=Treponema sp. TaxID=166 RepID=UPI003F08BCBE
MKFYCISVRTGAEDKFKESVLSFVEGEERVICGRLHVLKKRMRLKKGKEYIECIFPGYVFLETDETDAAKLMCFSEGKGFLRFLPSSKDLNPLAQNDSDIVQALLQFGSTVGIVPVTFDKGDRIVIMDGPFKDFSGRVVAVNRRNKRLNIEIDFMNGVKVVGLTYEEVQRQGGSI